MKNVSYLCLPLTVALLFYCSETIKIVNESGNYPVKEYNLERDPKINVWGVGVDFIHADNDTDIQYLTENSIFPYDLKFFVVKVYYTDNKGDTKTEGCPAILLSSGVKACKVGEGLSFFDNYSQIDPSIAGALKTDPPINYQSAKNADGLYDRTVLFQKLDSLIIGQKFRSGVLVIPAGKTETDVQPVFLINTRENGYVKFMVSQFKGTGPDEKKTTVKWQVIQK